MNIPFILQIDKIQSLDSIFLSQGDFSGIISQYLESEEFNLYIISYVDKYRFDIENCVVKQQKLFVRLCQSSNLYELSNIEVKSIEKDKSTSRNLFISDINGNLFNLTINEFIVNYCSDISRKQEIVYIGQSKNIENRFQNHEKLIRAFASISDEKDILLNFVKPSFGYADLSVKSLIHFNKETIVQTDFKTFEYQDLINLTERILVKFYQPLLNTEFLKTDFSKDSTVQKIKDIAQNEIFIISNSIDSNGYSFYAPNQFLDSNSFQLNEKYEFDYFNE